MDCGGQGPVWLDHWSVLGNCPLTRDSYISPGTFPSEKDILSWNRPMVGRSWSGESSHIIARTVEDVLWEFCSWALGPECS